MAYIHSSPWQDAANFGSSVGDRLAEALINLPLQRQAMQQQLLAQRAMLAQRNVQNQLAQKRIDVQQSGVEERQRHDKAMEPSPYVLQMKQLQGETALASKENLAKQKEIDDLTKFNIADDTKRMGVEQRAQAVHERMLQMSSAEAMKAPHEELHGLSIDKAMEAVQNPMKYGLSAEQADDLAKTIPLVYKRIKDGAMQEQGGQRQSTMGDALPPAPVGNQGTTNTPKISSKEEFDKLPPGTSYIGPSGLLATKPQKQKPMLPTYTNNPPTAQTNSTPTISLPKKTGNSFEDQRAADIALEKQQAAQRLVQDKIDARSSVQRGNEDDFETAAKLMILDPDNITSPGVADYLAQFTPQQRVVQIQALKQRAMQLNKEYYKAQQQ